MPNADSVIGRGPERRCRCCGGLRLWRGGRRGFIPVGSAPLAQDGASDHDGPITPIVAKPRLTMPGQNPMTRFPLRRAACDRGGVAERLKAADCKSADV